MSARAAALICILLVAGCSVPKRHPRLATVAATTVIFSAGVGAPLSLDCDNPTSTCSTRYTIGVFSIGAAVGFGIGLLAVHELELGKPAVDRRPRDPATTVCSRARQRISKELATTCTAGTVEFPTVDSCECQRRKGSSKFLCVITASVACGSGELCGSCRCADTAGASDGCSCFATACPSAAGGVP